MGVCYSLPQNGEGQELASRRSRRRALLCEGLDHATADAGRPSHKATAVLGSSGRPIAPRETRGLERTGSTGGHVPACSCCLAPAAPQPSLPRKQRAAAGAPARRFALWSTRLHDSVQSLGAPGSQRLRRFQRHAQPERPQGPSCGAGGGARDGAGPAPAKQQREVLRDLLTGDIIPDFGVEGLLDVIHLLGSGGSACTYLCRDLATKELVAVKFLARPLPKVAVPLLLREVELQARLGQAHPNIVSIHEIILTDSHLALVLDYAAGGTLTDSVASRWESALERHGLHLSEEEARFFFRQFADAVDYCHQSKVAHRDLKLDNTLLDGAVSLAPRVKLCDFGFARPWGADGSGDMHTALGTPVYMSPQLLGAKYGNQGFDGAAADVWACGIMLFVSLLGSFPFDNSKHKDPNSEEAHLEVRMAQERLVSWRDHPGASAAISKGALSVECGDLLDKMLHPDEAKRISMVGIKSHPWLGGPLASQLQEEAWELLQEESRGRRAACQQPRAARQLKRLKEAMLAMMAAATRTAADLPLASFDALKGSPGGPSAAGDGEGGRRRRNDSMQRESMPIFSRYGAPGEQQQQQQQQQHQEQQHHQEQEQQEQELLRQRQGHDASRRRRSTVDGHYTEGAARSGGGGGAHGVGGARVPEAPDGASRGSTPGSRGGGSCAAGGAATTTAPTSYAATPRGTSPGAGLSEGGSHVSCETDLGSSDEGGAAAAGGSSPRKAVFDAATARPPSWEPTPSSGACAGVGSAGAPSSPEDAPPPPVAAPPAAPRLTPWGLQDHRECGGGLVWRLPLVVWAPDEALAVPLPELQVAAGALIRQLQGSFSGSRPRLLPLCKRMSWPMNPTAGAVLCASGLDGL